MKMDKHFRVNGSYSGGGNFTQFFEKKKDAVAWARKNINDKLVLVDTIEVLEYKIVNIPFRKDK